MSREHCKQQNLFGPVDEAIELLQDAKPGCAMFLKAEIEKFIEKHGKPQKKIVADKRYYYHRRLKHYSIDAAKRLIDLPYERFEDIPVGDRYYIGQLISLGYNIQLKLI